MAIVHREVLLPSETYLTTRDVAERLGVSAERVRQLRRERRLVPIHTTHSGVALYSESGIREYARLRREKDASTPATFVA